MSSSRFSISSVLLSYFLVAGGIAIGLLAAGQLKLTSELGLYGVLFLGGAIGGVIAARASRGSTVIEPALGAVLVIATLVGVFLGTGIGELLWHVAKDAIVKTVGYAAAAAAVGAIVGAIGAERLWSGHSSSPLVWAVYIAIAALGACIVAMVVLVGGAAHGATDDDALAGLFFGAMALGSVLTGLTVGASAPRRLLVATLLGVVAGVMGFYLLLRELPGTSAGDDDKAAAGFAIIGVGCGLLAMAGAAIAWTLVGKKARG
ncbi:MAG: hypothetical protein IPL61_23240 [Myxococcales bacterium]|nr:hypothetical protein [Myxococcales bacterium]